MSSIELVDYINSQDLTQNLSHANFLAKVPKVLGDAAHSFECTGTYTNGTGAVLPRKIYTFPKREACLMAMSYSYDLQAKVFDKMTALETEKAAPAAPTTASMFMQSAHIMLEMESRTAALEKQQIALTARLDEVVENNVLKVCPQNAEPITHIRRRIGKAFGLSASVIDEAMRQLPYSPKPAGMVLNDNEAAQGSHYAVFWIKDVSTMFKRFVAECQRETTAFVSHPFIDARFKLAAGKECK